MSLQMETEEREGFAESRAPSDGLALAEIRDELRAQRAEARRVHGAFAFFAAGALIIALANLVAVAVKLDGTPSNTVTVTAPAAAAAPAPAAAAAHASSVTLSEFNVAPKPADAASGPVTFNVSNAGKVEHEFVVVKTSKPPCSTAERPTKPGTWARSAVSSRARRRPSSSSWPPATTRCSATSRATTARASTPT